MAQPPRISRRLQGLPPELPGVSSTEENTDHSSGSPSETWRNLFPEFSRASQEGVQILPSPPHSNVETSLALETFLFSPSTHNLEVLPTSNPGYEHSLPSDHNSRVSNTPFQFPDLIQFTEPRLETYWFPNEGRIEVSQVQSIVNQLLNSRNSNPESLFEAYSESSLPLNEEWGSNSTPLRTESLNSEVTNSSHPTFDTYHSYNSRDLETPSLENISLTTSSVGNTYSLGSSALPFLFTEYQPAEPRPDLVRRPFHFHFNQPLSYEDPFVLIQLPGPTAVPWQNTPEYQQILRDGRNHTMDPFPSLMDSDPDLQHDPSMTDGPIVPLLHSNHWVPFS